MKRTAVLILALIMSVSLFVSCSSKSADSLSGDYSPRSQYNSEAYDADYGYSDSEEKVEYELFEDGNGAYANMSSSSASVADTRKIIKTVELSLETKAFDAAVAMIRSSCTAAGGYMEYSYVSGDSILSSGSERNASFTVRIPAQGLDAYCDSLSGDSFNVLSRSENSSDITDTYYDTEARLKSLQTQEERLLSMLEGATELEYMLQIEETLADVRYQIESYYSTIKRYDSQVSLSTVTIDLREVIEYQPAVVTPITFGERIANAFTKTWVNFADGCKSFAVDFVWALPTLLVWAVIITAAVFVIRRVIRKRRARKAEKADKDD